MPTPAAGGNNLPAGPLAAQILPSGAGVEVPLADVALETELPVLAAIAGAAQALTGSGSAPGASRSGSPVQSAVEQALRGQGALPADEPNRLAGLLAAAREVLQEPAPGAVGRQPNLLVLAADAGARNELATLLSVADGAQGASAGTTPRAAATPIPVPVPDPRWGQALGERVVWMIQDKTSSAQLSLNPRELGPVEVRISVDAAGETRVQFASAHGAVREAIEAALPRLREMLAQAGVALANVDVSQHSLSQQRESSPQAGPGGQRGSGPADAPGTDTTAEISVRVGLVDLYA